MRCYKVGPIWLGMGTYAHGPHTQEIEAEELVRSLGQPGLQSEILSHSGKWLERWFSSYEHCSEDFHFQHARGSSQPLIALALRDPHEH